IGHHDRGFLLSRGAHHDLQLTLDQATVESRGETAAHCGRCHSAQGYKGYLSQLSHGNTGPLTTPPGYTGTLTQWLTDLGLTTAPSPRGLTARGPTKAWVAGPARPPSHEPHAAELRFEGSTPVLPAGFAVSGAGKGALSMPCHNTRNGLHDATHPPTSTSAPH